MEVVPPIQNHIKQPFESISCSYWGFLVEMTEKIHKKKVPIFSAKIAHRFMGLGFSH